VCLDSSGKVMETSVVLDFASHESAWEIGNLIGEGVPFAAYLFRFGLSRWLDRMALFDKRVKVDHFDVRVEGFHDCIAGDPRWERGHGGEDRSFRHVAKWFVYSKKDCGMPSALFLRLSR
jgi:hypothetical protein